MGLRWSHVNWPADLTTFSVDGQIAERVTGGMCRSMRLDHVVALLAYRDGARLMATFQQALPDSQGEGLWQLMSETFNLRKQASDA